MILKMLYEENPKFLSEVFSNLFNETVASQIGVKFTQQTRKRGSIPDGEISQSPFSICLETKTSDCFRENQLLPIPSIAAILRLIIGM
jgi:hypothetical protein